jgi:hypothetical protein
MQQTDLDYFRRWFTEYVAQFYNEVGDGPRPIRLKEEHTKRACKQILLLGHELGLSEEDLLLAETTALFHDLGRFPQWRRYRTFIDSESRDHAQLAREVISEQRILSRLPPDEQELIIETILLHNLRQLPADLPSRSLFFAQLLRDADKLDIWQLIITQQSEQSDLLNTLAGDIPISATYSQEILADLWEEKAPDFGSVENRNDMILLRMGWVFDLNFGPSCRKVLENRYVEQLCDQLPDNQEIAKLQEHLISYLKGRSEAHIGYFGSKR